MKHADKSTELMVNYAKEKERILKGCMPVLLNSQEAANRIRCGIFPDGREVYSFDGKPFLEIMPPEPYSKTAEDGSFTVGINCKFHTLNNKETGKA